MRFVSLCFASSLLSLNHLLVCYCVLDAVAAAAAMQQSMNFFNLVFSNYVCVCVVCAKRLGWSFCWQKSGRRTSAEIETDLVPLLLLLIFRIASCLCIRMSDFSNSCLKLDHHNGLCDWIVSVSGIIYQRHRLTRDWFLPLEFWAKTNSKCCVQNNSEFLYGIISPLGCRSLSVCCHTIRNTFKPHSSQQQAHCTWSSQFNV